MFVDYRDRQTPDIQYQHDRAGRRVAVRQGRDYQLTLNHDGLGKVISETVEQPDLKPHTVTISFDDAGRRSGFEWSDGANEMKVAYTNNPAEKLSGVSDGTHAIDYQYLANSPYIELVTYRTQGQDIMRTLKTRDRLGRLLRTGTERVSDGFLLSSHDYTYNSANQRTSVKEATGEEWKYGYDSLGQLVSGERKSDDGELLDHYSYQFDDIGNRQQASEAGKQTSYEANLLNQYQTSLSNDKANQITRYRHDSDGNLLEDEKWHYKWNAENRLIIMEANDASQRLEFRYDPQGRRISKNILEPGERKSTWKKKSTIHFVYDDWNLIGEFDAEGNVERSHLWGVDMSGSHQGAGGIGGLILNKDHQSGSSSYALYDGNGNVVYYVGTEYCEILEHRDYGPFGNLVGVAGVGLVINHFPFGFSTKYVDEETGNSYYGFRYYNPKTGRWLNRDPIEEVGGVNFYAMVNNGPIANIDFLGFYTLKWKGDWTQLGKNKVIEAINNTRRETVRLLEEANKLLNDPSSECGCAREKLRQLIALLTALRDDIDSSNPLNIYKEKLEKDKVALAWRSPLPLFYNDWLKFNAYVEWGPYSGSALDSPGIVIDVFHELTHLVGTDDGSPDEWNNAEELENLVGVPLAGWRWYRGAVEGITCD